MGKKTTTGQTNNNSSKCEFYYFTQFEHTSRIEDAIFFLKKTTTTITNWQSQFKQNNTACATRDITVSQWSLDMRNMPNETKKKQQQQPNKNASLGVRLQCVVDNK